MIRFLALFCVLGRLTDFKKNRSLYNNMATHLQYRNVKIKMGNSKYNPKPKSKHVVLILKKKVTTKILMLKISKEVKTNSAYMLKE
jgi:hypothetical protein